MGLGHKSSLRHLRNTKARSERAFVVLGFCVTRLTPVMAQERYNKTRRESPSCIYSK